MKQNRFFVKPEDEFTNNALVQYFEHNNISMVGQEQEIFVNGKKINAIEVPLQLLNLLLKSKSQDAGYIFKLYIIPLKARHAGQYKLPKYNKKSRLKKGKFIKPSTKN